MVIVRFPVFIWASHKSWCRLYLISVSGTYPPAAKLKTLVLQDTGCRQYILLCIKYRFTAKVGRYLDIFEANTVTYVTSLKVDNIYASVVVGWTHTKSYTTFHNKLRSVVCTLFIVCFSSRLFLLHNYHWSIVSILCIFPSVLLKIHLVKTYKMCNFSPLL